MRIFSYSLPLTILSLDYSILTNGIFIASLLLAGNFISVRFKTNSILSFILIGIIIGPNLLQLLPKETGSAFAEVGIMFLLFLIGLHIDFSELKDMKKYLVNLGMLQLAITSILLFIFFFVTLNAFGLDFSLLTTIFVSMTLSLSSTAIIMPRLIENNLLNTELGSAKIGILLFQDIIAPLILIFIPLISKGGITPASLYDETLHIIGALTLLVTCIVILFRLFFTTTMEKLEDSEHRGFNMLALALIALVCGAISHALGISYGIGAFIGGIVAGTTKHKDSLMDKMEGMKELFLAMFFVYVGMLVDLRAIWANLPIILTITIIIKLIKIMGTFAACRILGIGDRNSFIILHYGYIPGL